MSASASHDPSIDPGELAELRLRAYGPNADIDGDPAALSRLAALEERARVRFSERQVTLAPSRSAESAHPVGSATPAALPMAAPDDAARIEVARTTRPPARAADRWRVPVVACAALAAVVLAGAVWNSIAPTQPAPQAATPDAADATAIVEVEDQQWSTSSAAGYTQFLDHLRGELLATPGLEAFEDRVIFEELRPFGGLYGRKVWAGPTTDREYCMVIANEPEPITGCIPADDAASPLTIVLPAGRSDPKGVVDTVLPPGNPISYTLRPDGTVVAAPAPGP